MSPFAAVNVLQTFVMYEHIISNCKTECIAFKKCLENVASLEFPPIKP